MEEESEQLVDGCVKARDQPLTPECEEL